MGVAEALAIRAEQNVLALVIKGVPEAYYLGGRTRTNDGLRHANKSRPALRFDLPPRIRFPTRPLRPSRFVSTVATLCNIPSRTTRAHSSSCR